MDVRQLSENKRRYGVAVREVPSTNRTDWPPAYVVNSFAVLLALLPQMLYGFEFVSLCFGIASAVLIGVAAFNLWKQIDLIIRGSKTNGLVTAIDFQPNDGGWSDNSYTGFGGVGGYNGWNRLSGRYYTYAMYTVDGADYTVRSVYGTWWKGYEVGQNADVWYDPGAPEIAVLGSRANPQAAISLLVGAGMCYISWVSAATDQHSGTFYR